MYNLIKEFEIAKEIAAIFGQVTGNNGTSFGNACSSKMVKLAGVWKNEGVFYDEN